MQKYKMEGDIRSESGGGCRVSIAVGFVLVLLAVLVAVGVGVIVHFAESSRVTCKFDFGSRGLWTESEVAAHCEKLAKQGNSEICNACPVPTTPERTPSVEPSTNTSTTTSTTTSTLTTEAPTAEPTTEPPSPPINYRLPSALKPVHYDVELKPDIYGNDLFNCQVNGSVSIILDVLEDTNNISLHSDSLNITESSVTLVSDQSTVPAVGAMDVNETTQILVISLDSSLAAGSKITLSMDFTTTLRTDRDGFYSESYRAENNETIFLAVTQFEATFARSAFPCFDEPAMKATFNITLLRKVNQSRNYSTLANTERIDTQPRDDDYVADIFAKTPIMSTYLLAFVVSDFQYMENITKNITYRTWASPNLIDNAHLAHDVGIKLYNTLEDIFDPNYPINKIDSIAVPNFKAGAMENWGLIIYKESIMFRPGFSSTSAFAFTPEVIAHELSHQWFGNIVSPKWWWWLWLNEAFASYFDWRLLVDLFPPRRKEEQFLVQAMHAAMVTDSTRSSHAMNNIKMESREQIEASFDTVTYSKGGSVVRMMCLMMGDKLFYQALNRYLQKYQYGVADDNDLLNTLTEEAYSQSRAINMSDTMDSWINQMNFPLVHVSRTGSGVIHVTQERFLKSVSEYEKAVNDTAPFDYLWQIPITYTSSTEKNFTKSLKFEERKWLSKTKKEDDITDVVFPDPNVSDSWVYVNTENAFYRVNYDEENWNSLIKQLNTNFKVIPPMHRAQLIHDAWFIAEAGKLNHAIALRTINFLKDDVDYVPWRALHRFLLTIDGHLERSVIYDAFRTFMVNLSKKAYEHYGAVSTEDDVTIDRYQRARIVLYACYYGNKQCRQDVFEIFKNWTKTGDVNSVHPDLRNIIYCNGVRYGDSEEFNFVFKKYKESAASLDPEEATQKSNLLKGLACTRQPSRIITLYHKMTFTTEIPMDDILILGAAIASNPYGIDIAWNMFKENYEMLSGMMPDNMMNGYIKSVTSSFNTEGRYQEIVDFMKTHNVTVHEKAFNTALEKAKDNIQWMKTHYSIIEAWLTESGYI